MIHVLVVDDSATVREILTRILRTEADLRVSVAPDALIAFDKMRKDPPDVIVLDLEMPRMDGLTFLRKVMTEAPTPVVVCSAHTARGSENALRALEEGAVEIVTKPQLGVRDFLTDSAVLMIEAIRAAAEVRLSPSRVAPGIERRHVVRGPVDCDVVIAMGASTGGTVAIRSILGATPTDTPPIVIAQHMPEHFTASFARGLARASTLDVAEARDGDVLSRGRVLVAPGNRHARVRRQGSAYVVQIDDGPLVNRHRPSIDVLFESIAVSVGARAIGVLLTGMGSDGARGLKAIRNAGGSTIVQDEATSVVFGMAKEAMSLDGADEVCPLPHIAYSIQRFVRMRA
jgi:two-component system chemotaxis response regulator CheB